MSLPVFTIDGILPPFIGQGPGDDPALMSPYRADAIECVARFGTSNNRRKILCRWLDHRAELRKIGLKDGFQWLDGSFLEEKNPKDLDLVCFFYLPTQLSSEEEQIAFWNQNFQLFDRMAVKADFSLDAFFLPLDSTPETLVSLSRYYLQLFSHQRESYLWKGMVQVSMDDLADGGAKELLSAPLPDVTPEEDRS